MFIDVFGAIFLFHSALETALNFLSFAAKHRGLVGDANRFKMLVGIEAGRVSAFEFFQKFLFVAAFENVVNDAIGFGEGENDEVVATAGLRTGGARFFVPGLAVNDAGDLVAGILAHAFPNAHHVAARRI